MSTLRSCPCAEIREMFLQKIKNKFSKGSAARDVATLTVGTVVAQTLTIVTTPLLTRLYTPADFGMLAVFLTVTGIAATLITGRYETSVLVPKKDAESANLVLLSFTLAVAGSAILVVISFFLPKTFWGFLGLATLGNWLPLAFAVAGATAIMAIAQAWLNRQKKYKQMAKLRVFQSASIVGLALLIYFLPNAPNGLLLGQIFACFFVAVVAIWFTRSAANVWQKENLPHTARTHQNAPKYLLPTALLDVATLQMPVILIASWFGESMAGQFSMAWRLLMMPMALVGGAVGQVFLQKFALTHHDSAQARKLLKSTWIVLMAMGILPMLLIFFWGPDLFSIILSEKWMAAGSMAALLAPMALAIFVSSPTSGTYIILGIQRYSPIFAVASLIYRPASLYFGLYTQNLMNGLKAWVICEVMQITIYQMVAWKKIKNIA